LMNYIFSSILYISSDYTFTENINIPIVVMADNIVIDGNGFTLQGPGIGNGIYLEGRTNVTITNVTITSWTEGIYFDSSSNNSITENTITNTYYGIHFYESSNNRIFNNIITNTYYGIYLDLSSNNTISGNTITNNYAGIGLEWYSSNNTISGNTITDNVYCGIILLALSSNNNTISGNTITDNIYGIYLEYSSNNTISGNIITDNDYGILLDVSSKNTISGNTITDNSIGILLAFSSNNNTISGNIITANTENGIWLWYSSNNVIYHNNFIDNAVQADDYNPANNDWYHTELLEGNYWSDYTGVDDGSGSGKHAIAGDGIGDTNIPWPGTDYDYYPFVMENGWELPADTTPPTTTIGLSGSLGQGGWYVSDVTVTLIAIDDLSGVAEIAYSFDGTVWNTYNLPFTIITEGSTTVYYNSTDNVGNVETTKTEIIQIDKTLPTVVLVNPSNETIIFGSNYIFDAEITDSHPEYVWYKWDDSTNNTAYGSPWNFFVDTTLVSDGWHDFWLYANDTSGLENSEYYRFLIDNTLPDITITEPPSDAIVYIGDIWINGTFDGTVSQVTSISINDTRFVLVEPVGAGPYGVTGSYSFMASIMETGEFGVEVFVQDEAGLTATATRHLTVTNTPPGTNVEVTDPITGVNLTFGEVTSSGTTTVTPSDTGPTPPSGFEVAGQYYDIVTTASYTGTITVAIPYDEAQVTGNEANLKIMHWNSLSGQWEDITTWVDTNNDIIYGEVTSLSTFAVITEKTSGGGGGGGDGDGDGTAPKTLVLTILSEIVQSVAPGTSVNVTVSVTDSSGKAIEGAAVTINIGDVTTLACEDKGDGIYYALIDTSNLSPGSYLISITANKSSYAETSTSFTFRCRSPFLALYVGILGVIMSVAVVGVLAALKKGLLGKQQLP